MLYFSAYLGSGEHAELSEGVKYWSDKVFGSTYWDNAADLSENIDNLIASMKAILKNINKTIVTLNNICFLNNIPTMIEHGELDIVPFTGTGAMFTGFVRYVPPQTAQASSSFLGWVTLYIPKKYTDSTHAASTTLSVSETIWYLIKVNNDIIASISSLKMLK